MELSVKLEEKVQKALREGAKKLGSESLNEVNKKVTVGKYPEGMKREIQDIAVEAIGRLPLRFYPYRTPFRLDNDWVLLGVYQNKGKYDSTKSALKDIDLRTEVMALYRGKVIWPKVSRYVVKNKDTDDTCEELFRDSISDMYIYRNEFEAWGRVTRKHIGAGYSSYIRDFAGKNEVFVELVANDSFDRETTWMSYNDFLSFEPDDVKNQIDMVEDYAIKAEEEKRKKSQVAKYGFYEGQMLRSKNGTRYMIRNILNDGSAIIEFDSSRFYKVSNSEARYGKMRGNMKELSEEEKFYYIWKLIPGKDPNYVPKKEKIVLPDGYEIKVGDRHESYLSEFYTIKSIDPEKEEAVILFDGDKETKSVPFDDIVNEYPMSFKLEKEADELISGKKSDIKPSIKGKAVDKEEKKSAYGITVGQRFKNNSGLGYTVVRINSSTDVVIKFDGDEKEYSKTADTVRKGTATKKKKVTEQDVKSLSIGQKLTLKDGVVVTVMARYPSTNEIRVMDDEGTRIRVNYSKLMSGRYNFSRLFGAKKKQQKA